MAWPLDSTQGFHALMSVVLFPMWLLSGAAFPADGGWLQWVVAANPLTYGVAGPAAGDDAGAGGRAGDPHPAVAGGRGRRCSGRSRSCCWPSAVWMTRRRHPREAR